METRIQNIENLAKRSLIAEERVEPSGDQNQTEHDDKEWSRNKMVYSPESRSATSRGTGVKSPGGERLRKPPVPKLAACQRVYSARSETVSPDKLKSKYNALKQQVKHLQKELDHIRNEKKSNQI